MSRDISLHPHNIREEMEELEARGEIRIARLIGPTQEVEVMYGLKKRIPLNQHYHHKSCGQCANLPGVPRASFFVHEQLGIDQYNDMEQTSCTAWNYHASGLATLESVAAVAARNWHRAYEVGYNFIIHCVTSFGNYQEMRHLLVKHKPLRDKARQCMEALGRELVIPEEIVHDSEVHYVLREEIARRAIHRFEGIRAVEHYGCHFFKQVSEDIIGGKRPVVLKGLAEALGIQVHDYSTFYNCCGFGFRHILVNRPFTRSALRQKLLSIQQEVDPDVILVNCTGCGTTFDKNQWIQKALGEEYHYPVLFYSQLAALALGADPYREAGLNFHATPLEPLLEKMGVPYKESMRELGVTCGREEAIGDRR